MSSDTAIPAWRKATYSNASGSCVEASSAAGRILVRDTTQRGTGPILRFTPADWKRFTASIIRQTTAGAGGHFPDL
jgi:Domain of unknown function (DUF397)